MATGIAIRNSRQVGVTPRSTLSTSTEGENTSTRPTSTRTTWVKKSATANSTFTLADSLTPRTFTSASTTTTTIPPTMSPGDSPSGSQNTAR